MIIGSRKIYYDKLSSTNTMAATLVKKGNIQEGTIVYAGFQYSGKGQKGNTWESEEGKNLLISIILYPISVKAENQFIISKVISLGISDFLVQLCGQVFIKWPNDIYIGDDKIAGILIENSVIRDEIEHSVAGIGININQEIFTGGAPNPTSLRLVTGKTHDTEQCLSMLATSIDARYKQLLYNKRSQINDDYFASLYRVGVWTEFNDNKGNFEGKIVAVTESGRLQIEDRRGRIYEYGFREVDFL